MQIVNGYTYPTTTGCGPSAICKQAWVFAMCLSFSVWVNEQSIGYGIDSKPQVQWATCHVQAVHAWQPSRRTAMWRSPSPEVGFSLVLKFAGGLCNVGVVELGLFSFRRYEIVFIRLGLSPVLQPRSLVYFNVTAMPGSHFAMCTCDGIDNNGGQYSLVTNRVFIYTR